MLNRINTVVVKILFLSIIIVTASCKEEKLHEFVEVNSNNNTQKYLLNFRNESISKLHEMEFAIPSSRSYSADSIVPLNYNSIDLGTFEELSISKTKSQVDIFNGDKLIYTFAYPEHINPTDFTMLNWITNSNSKHIKLLSCTYKDSAYSNDRSIVKILGYSNAPITNHKDFNWEFFLTDKDNLFNASLNPIGGDYTYNWALNRE